MKSLRKNKKGDKPIYKIKENLKKIEQQIEEEKADLDESIQQLSSMKKQSDFEEFDEVGPTGNGLLVQALLDNLDSNESEDQIQEQKSQVTPINSNQVLFYPVNSSSLQQEAL